MGHARHQHLRRLRRQRRLRLRRRHQPQRQPQLLHQPQPQPQRLPQHQAHVPALRISAVILSSITRWMTAIFPAQHFWIYLAQVIMPPWFIAGLLLLCRPPRGTQMKHAYLVAQVIGPGRHLSPACQRAMLHFLFPHGLKPIPPPARRRLCRLKAIIIRDTFCPMSEEISSLMAQIVSVMPLITNGTWLQ